MNEEASRKSTFIWKLVAGFFGVLFLGNILFLDYHLFFREASKQGSSDQQQQFTVVDLAKETNSQPPSDSETPTQIIKDSCYPYSCVDLIRAATGSATLKTTGTPSDETTGETKESYIPFGSGEGQNDQYEDVPGLQAYINPSLYTNISKVLFEVSLRIPTSNGKAYVRLFNVTDNQAVSGSEVSVEGSTSLLLISPSLTLPNSNKLYKIQLKSTLRAPAVLDQSRVHIISQ